MSSKGFKVPLSATNTILPDGSIVEDGTLFRRNFLSIPACGKYIIEEDFVNGNYDEANAVIVSTQKPASMSVYPIEEAIAKQTTCLVRV